MTQGNEHSLRTRKQIESYVYYTAKVDLFKSHRIGRSISRTTPMENKYGGIIVKPSTSNLEIEPMDKENILSHEISDSNDVTVGFKAGVNDPVYHTVEGSIGIKASWKWSKKAISHSKQ